jgi:chitinase
MTRPFILGSLFCLLLSFSRASPHQVSPATPLLSRQSSSTTYNCDENNPCSNGACCGKSGYCGYGPTYCGTTGTSPNDACWSNCDAHAPCGQYAANPGEGCPLNVCCSQYVHFSSLSIFIQKMMCARKG